jgi:3-methyladenine DNA glycosylase AlkD
MATQRKSPDGSSSINAATVLKRLEKLSSKSVRNGLARYAIPTEKAYGVSVGTLRKLAKELGRSHTLAAELWKTDRYEARMLATFVDEPLKVTPAQMNRWCRDFDNWAICDTACFALFARTAHAWNKVTEWGDHREEFIKRASFALLASLVGHDKKADDQQFARHFDLIERGAQDERNFVKKAVSWALRSIGKRSVGLNQAALGVASRLSGSTVSSARWVGKDAVRDLQSAATMRRFMKKSGALG